MIDRIAERRVKKLNKSFRVTVLTGPRQSGKTTLLKDGFRSYKYYNLEDLNTFDVINADLMDFARENSRVIIDEVQRIPDLLSAIQVVVDERNLTGDFILSGSQNLLISDKISQSLAGRAAYQTLLPLSINELKKANLLRDSFAEQIWTGFYPAIYHQSIDPNIYYEQYVATYVERDLRSIKNVQDLGLFRKFMGLLAGRIGQLVNYESLANDTGIAVKTVEQWLSILESSYLIYRLRPYYANIGKRLIKSAKIYFTDTGLACYLLGVSDEDSLKTHYLLGGLFENMVIMDVRKRILNHVGLRDNLYFYRDSNGSEVDLLIDYGSSRLMPIEIKSAAKYSKDFIDGIISMRAAFSDVENTEIMDGFVVYTGNEEYETKGVKYINWAKVTL
jgi:predicted AAA+ superfamily ATPase